MGTSQFLPGIIVTSNEYEAPVRFFVRNLADTIQNHHANGRFFELRELLTLYKHFPPGGVYLDVGANVGNHILYVAACNIASALIAIEPNPVAIEILDINLLINNLGHVERQHLGVALSDHRGRANLFTVHTNNIGETLVQESDDGLVELIPGDELFGERQIDFIKMDVEGHEMQALAGLKKTIEKNRPIMFIEVDDENRKAFNAWMKTNRYRIAESFKPRPNNENLMIRPVEKPLEGAG